MMRVEFSRHIHFEQWLVAIGAAKDRANGDWMSPLWIAAARGFLDTVRVLVEAGANKNQATRRPA